MSLRLNPSAESPGLRYTHPESQHQHFAWDIHTLMSLVNTYRQQNNFPVVSQEDVEDAVCQSLPANWCHQASGANRNDFDNLRLTKDDVLRGTMALSEIAARRAASTLIPSWTPFVDQATAEARAATCSQCYAKTPVTGCRSCDTYISAISAIIGDRKTSFDPFLSTSACGICKCSLSAQVHVKGDILLRGMDDGMKAKFAGVGHCWRNSLTEEPEPSSTAP